MPSLESLYASELGGSPSMSYTSRSGANFTNDYLVPDGYDVNGIHHKLEAGSAAYGVQGATTAVTTTEPPAAKPSESAPTGYGWGARA